MSNPHRLAPDWPFPKYVFIPSRNPHPKKAGGHMEGLPDPIAQSIDLEHPEGNSFLRYSLDLLNHGYFWESHVYFEALWNTHKRTGPVSDFLKAMIKLGAAGVKKSIDQEAAAVGHYERGIELLELVKADVGSEFLGFNLDSLIEDISQGIRNKNFQVKVIPVWK